MFDWHEIGEFLANLLDEIGDKIGYYIKLFLLGVTLVYAAGFFSSVFPALTQGLYGLMIVGSIFPFIGSLFLTRFQLESDNFWSGFLFVAIPAVAIVATLWLVFGFGIFAAGGII